MCQKLSLEELRTIATAAGIKFTIGNENVKDKLELIYTFDEADFKELDEVYNSIISKQSL
jgi:hypothetical protein